MRVKKKDIVSNVVPVFSLFLFLLLHTWYMMASVPAGKSLTSLVRRGEYFFLEPCSISFQRAYPTDLDKCYLIQSSPPLHRQSRGLDVQTNNAIDHQDLYRRLGHGTKHIIDHIGFIQHDPGIRIPLHRLGRVLVIVSPVPKDSDTIPAVCDRATEPEGRLL